MLLVAPRNASIELGKRIALALCLLKKAAAELRRLLSLRPTMRVARCVAMSLEFITAGVLICLFGMIALMPSFDGRWE